MGIYDQFTIVEEKATSNIVIKEQDWQCNCNKDIFKFNELATLSTLEFNILDDYGRMLQIKDTGTVSSNSVPEPMAQIVLWKWNQQGEQEIQKTIILNKGGTTDEIDTRCSMVVRILKKREKLENPFPPFNSLDDDLTVNIGNSQVTLSARLLMRISPMVMKMKEGQQRSLSLDGLGIKMEQFMEFLEAISIPFLQQTVLPNPKNVLDLLMLADYFQLDWMKSHLVRCLSNCPEIPLIDRFLLVERYRLDYHLFLRRLNVENLRLFFKANRARLDACITTKEFQDAITRISDKH
uniref:BTB domain-containing protein n=1 Tax=Globodera rostochiensis TaxID=31243 RepID=A0A914I154_GLORO